MKKILFSLLFMALILFTFCKKDEYVGVEKTVNDTVAMITHDTRDEYFLYDNMHLYLDATTPGAISYQWLPTNETSPVVEFIPNDYRPFPVNLFGAGVFGAYEVLVTLPDTTIKYIIGVKADESTVYCANSFTPNNDGMNDYWGPYYIDAAVTINDVNIYDEHNKRLFHASENENIFWDGKYNDKVCDVGIYYYTIHYTSVQGSKRSKEGMLQILR
jgi:gliding motility-associated-like protein